MENIGNFLKNNSIEHIFLYCNDLIKNPTPENIKTLKQFLLVKDSGTFEKHIIPKYISRLFLFLGKEGLNILEETVKEAPGSIYPTSILSTIYCASQGKLQELTLVQEDSDFILKPKISEDISQFANETLTNYIIEAFNDYDMFINLIQFIYLDSMKKVFKGDINKRIFDIITNSTIRINKKILIEYDQLINSKFNEETYHMFFQDNLCLIDPLASKVFNKSKLGADHITDFVIKRLDNEYLLVEIEKPYSKIFTKRDDFSSEFSHAMGQVLNFQEWVETNIAYAQKIFPNISSPQGLLIIGMKINLSIAQIKKLNRLNINNRGRFKVITFDEILEQGKRFYENIYLG